MNVPNVTGLLDGVVKGSNDLLTLPRVASLDHPLVNVLSKGLSGDGQLVAGHQTLLDQEGHDGCWDAHATRRKFEKIKHFRDAANVPGIPPIVLMSSMTYFPLGFKSAKKGILSETLWKSSMVKLMPTDRAMARK